MGQRTFPNASMNTGRRGTRKKLHSDSAVFPAAAFPPHPALHAVCDNRKHMGLPRCHLHLFAFFLNCIRVHLCGGSHARVLAVARLERLDAHTAHHATAGAVRKLKLHGNSPNLKVCMCSGKSARGK